MLSSHEVRMKIIYFRFPSGGYKIGDVFAVQHGPLPTNKYFFRVLAVNEKGQAIKTQLTQ